MKWDINNWLLTLIKAGDATVEDIGRIKLITLNSNCSNWFGVGIDLEGGSPFLAAQDAFFPWFGKLEWSACFMDLERSVLVFAIEGDNEWLGVGIKVRKDRVGWLWNDGVGDEIDIRRIKWKDEGVMVSSKVANSVELLIIPNLENHISYIEAEEAKYMIEVDVYDGYEEEH